MRNGAGRGSEGYLAGMRAGLPFALVVGAVAISFGVLSPIVFSVITFSVTAQFAVATVMGAGGFLYNPNPLLSG
jgi:hypothetical protein